LVRESICEFPFYNKNEYRLMTTDYELAYNQSKIFIFLQMIDFELSNMALQVDLICISHMLLDHYTR